MAVSKRTRYEVLKRDNHTCRYCHETDSPLTVDHVVPVALGGTDAPDNLVAACKDCNAGKSSTSPDSSLIEDVSQDALRWSAAMKLASERIAAREEPLNEYIRTVEAEIDLYGGAKALGFPYDWRDSAEQFYRAGLPIEGLTRAIAIAVSKANVSWSGKWRYACGVGWSLVREIRDEAQRIVTEGD